MAVEIKSNDIFSHKQFEKHSKIYAGPGAGKTYFLVQNVKEIITKNPLITESHDRKVLCVTYTNAAVDEIKRRLDTFGEYAEVFTIHGFINQYIIRFFQQDLREIIKKDFDIEVKGTKSISSQIEGLGILQGVDVKDIYNLIYKETGEDPSVSLLSYSKKDMAQVEVNIKKFVDNVRAHSMELKHPNKIVSAHVKPIKKYIWSNVRKLTFDEILYFGYRILESNPTALYALRVKFPFIFVDEFQDTNPLQTLLIKLIGEKNTVITVVGDVAQSIYSFQGARPDDFLNFTIKGGREMEEYVINGNRRSTANIVNFCNFLRQSDTSVKQVSLHNNGAKEDGKGNEVKKIHFLIGVSEEIDNIIYSALENGGVVLTRTWADAFAYIRGIDEDQVKLLKKIYNYYNRDTSAINIREEIIEHNNVKWVRAFRLIFNLWESYNKGSLIDILKSFYAYEKCDMRSITPKGILLIDKLLHAVFSELDEQNLTCDVINNLNNEFEKDEYQYLRETVFSNGFFIQVFDEYDNNLRETVSQLYWTTSYKLFKDVFSENSKFMTVHKSKGLEWDKVIVSVIPNLKMNKITLKDLFSNPQLIDKNKTGDAAEEFTRLYYVACSRAKDDLYIRIADGDEYLIHNIRASLDAYMATNGEKINYEFIGED